MRWISAQQMFFVHSSWGPAACRAKAGCWHMHNWAGGCSFPSLLSFFLSNQQDRIRALEITAGCKPPWERLCSHLRSPPTLGKIFISIWTVNYHTAGLNCLYTQFLFQLEPIHWHVYSNILFWNVFHFSAMYFFCNRVSSFSQIYGVLLFLQYKILKDQVEEEEKESCVWAALSFLMCMEFLFFPNFYLMWHSEKFNFHWILQLGSNNYF